MQRPFIHEQLNIKPSYSFILRKLTQVVGSNLFGDLLKLEYEWQCMKWSHHTYICNKCINSHLREGIEFNCPISHGTHTINAKRWNHSFLYFSGVESSII